MDDAEADLGRARAAGADPARAADVEGRLRTLQGSVEEAMTVFARADLDGAPGLERLTLLALYGDEDTALDQADRLLAARARGALAPGDAARVVEDAARSARSAAGATRLLASIERSLGHDALVPRIPVLEARAALLLRAGRPAEALAACDGAEALSALDLDLMTTRADALRALGRNERGRARRERARPLGGRAAAPLTGRAEGARALLRGGTGAGPRSPQGSPRGRGVREYRPMSRAAAVALLTCLSPCLLRGEEPRQVSSVAGRADLQTAVALSCGATTVLLGEASHGTASAIDLKAALVKELITRCGFTHVVFESQLYDFEALKRKYGTSSASISELLNAIGGLWATSRELDDLAHFLHERALTHELTLSGIDGQVGGAMNLYSQTALAADLTASVFPRNDAHTAPPKSSDSTSGVSTPATSTTSGSKRTCPTVSVMRSSPLRRLTSPGG